MAMLAMIGRVTMLGLARCAGTGGNYRTAQWFFHTVIAWLVLFCVFFRQPMLGAMDTHLLDFRSTCKQGKSVGLYQGSQRSRDRGAIDWPGRDKGASHTGACPARPRLTSPVGAHPCGGAGPHPCPRGQGGGVGGAGPAGAGAAATNPAPLVAPAVERAAASSHGRGRLRCPSGLTCPRSRA
jgi:hypothetical protein